MFGPMKEALRGRNFSSDEGVIDAGQNSLKTQSKNFFSDGIKNKLVKRCNRRVEVEGDYVEKYCLFKINFFDKSRYFLTYPVRTVTIYVV
jgi:hypothetical protein